MKLVLHRVRAGTQVCLRGRGWWVVVTEGDGLITLRQGAERVTLSGPDLLAQVSAWVEATLA